jgi:hypothetical protein
MVEATMHAAANAASFVGVMANLNPTGVVTHRRAVKAVLRPARAGPSAPRPIVRRSQSLQSVPLSLGFFPLTRPLGR